MKHYPYLPYERRDSSIWSFPLDATPPKQLTNITTDEIYNFAWSADGKQLAIIGGTSVSDTVLISEAK